MIINLNKGFFIVLLVFYVVSCNNINKVADIYGIWKGSHYKNEISIIFNKDFTCVLKYFDLESNNFETITGNYELDFSKTPISLSIRNISQLNHPLHTIIKFINDDSIMMAEFSTKAKLRPIAFETEKIIILNRIQELN